MRATVAWTGLLLPSVEAAAESLMGEDPHRAGSRDPRAETLREREHLTGGWWGARERWKEQGLTWHGEWMGEAWANLAGGLSRGVVVEGLAQMNLDLDLNRWTGWRMGRLRVGAILPHGESPTGERVGDLQGLSNIDAFRDELAPYETWWEQDFGHGAWSLRTGLLAADVEFAFTDGGGNFLNSGFGWPSGIALNTVNTGPAFFRSALGLRLRQTVEETWQWQIGVYDGDTFDGDVTGDSATDFRLGGDDGWFVIAEVAKWRLGNEGALSRSHLRIGGWLHTAAFSDSDSGDWRGGTYVALDIPLWAGERSEGAASEAGETGAELGRSVAAFARCSWAPDASAEVEWSGDAGLLFAGWWPGRFEDVFGVGVAWARRSDRARAEESEPLLGEVAIEVTWRLALSSWCEIQPDYQWILSLGDATDREAAHVIGIRTHLTF